MRIDSHATDTALLDAALAWAHQAYPLQRHRTLAAPHAAAQPEQAVWAETAALGWHAVRLPETLGGLGASLAQACSLADAKGYSLLALPWAEHAVLCLGMLLAARPADSADSDVSAHPAASWLARAGTQRWAATLQEPGQRHPWQTPTCTATTATEHTGGWRLHGAKAAAPGLAQADCVIVSARLQGADTAGDTPWDTSAQASAELGLFVVDMQANPPAAGYRVHDDAPGLDGHRRAALQLDGLWVSPQALLARAATAQAVLHAALDQTCMAACAEASALARRALVDTIAHLGTREQFGQKIGQFQALRHRVADMFVATEYASAMTWGTIALLDALAQPPHAMAAAVSAAKADVLREARWVTEQAVQLHGALGVCDEVAVSHAYKRVVALDAMLGDADWHLQRVAAHRVMIR